MPYFSKLECFSLQVNITFRYLQSRLESIDRVESFIGLYSNGRLQSLPSKVTDNENHSSLLQYEINYGRKKHNDEAMVRLLI